jgi:hypothetical protein
MQSFTWMAALALSLAAPATVKCRDGSAVSLKEGCALHGGVPAEVTPQMPSPARDALTPAQRPPDRPAHESPYSAFGAPHARRPGTQVHRHTGRRMHCKDGTVQTRGPKSTADVCDGHGGVK